MLSQSSQNFESYNDERLHFGHEEVMPVTIKLKEQKDDYQD